MADFATKLKSLRKQKKLTVLALAKKAKLSQKRFYALENRQAVPLLKEIFRLAQALELSAEDHADLKASLPPIDSVSPTTGSQASPSPWLLGDTDSSRSGDLSDYWQADLSEVPSAGVPSTGKWIYWKKKNTLVEMLKTSRIFGGVKILIRAPGEKALWVSAEELRPDA
jgi:transcriptional regulator with XRE-family HTH domain